MPLAVIEFALDPVLRLSDTSSVRYETIGLAIVILLGLLVAQRIASRTPSLSPVDPAQALRTDDLVFIVVGAVPGAIIGGRLGYVLDHLDFYRANSGAILDPAQGGMTLTLAVPLGILTGSLIARLLGAPLVRWLEVATLPLLFVLAAGKLVGLLGATGQGTFSEEPWATVYRGPGPWGSLAAEVPAHPSQVYEAIALTAGIAVLALVSRIPGVLQRQGVTLFLALGGWAAARFVVAFTWRDPAVVGPLRTEQAMLLGVVAVAVVGLLFRWRAPAQVPGAAMETARIEGSPVEGTPA